MQRQLQMLPRERQQASRKSKREFRRYKMEPQEGVPQSVPEPRFARTSWCSARSPAALSF